MSDRADLAGVDGRASAAAPASPPHGSPRHMGDLEQRHEERLSRQQAAERLIDIAYALTAGGPLEVSMAGQRIKVPVPNELHLGRELRANGDRVELELELTWPSPED